MRKMVSLFLCVLLVGALVVPASAAGTEFTVTPAAATVSPGDTVTLTVDVKTAEACKSFGVLVAYDENVFEFVSSTCDGAGFGYPAKTTSADVEDSESTWVGLGAMNVDSSAAGSSATAKAPAGTVGTIVLKVKDGVAAGTYTLTNRAAVGNDGAKADAVVNNVVITVEEKPAGLLGDADSDGYVDSWDATLVARYDVGIIGEDDLNLSVCDVDGDGYVDSWDATLIARYDVGLITAFPAEK